MAQKLKISAIKTKLLLLHLMSAAAASPFHVVKTLPGYQDNLPFKLETGYIGVGEDEDVQLFYYFVESERDPEKDPLVFWITGGPGCSGFSALVYEIGPLNFDLSSFDGSLPSFILNSYSWTKIASIIFIDAPVGTGFSYANTSRGYYASDTKSSSDNYMFLRKWLLNHPSFLKNRLYVAGDSYGGKIVPMVAFEIAEGNEAGLQPRMNLQGYFIGNSMTDVNKDSSETVDYAHRMALISDEYYELAKSSCNGEYVNPDPDNIQCTYALRLIKDCTKNLFTDHILEPNCKFSSHRPDDTNWGLPTIEDIPYKFLFLSKEEEPGCRYKNYWPSYIWARDESVQEALHIRKGTTEEWMRCNRSLSYEYDVESVMKYHKLLNEKGYQILAYSGDHDFLVPYLRTLKWIHSLNLTIHEEWRPWTVDGQVAGYTEEHRKGEAFITFATVKGAGHTAPEYKRKECFAMVSRWLSTFSL
ncbi:serine carboxypeptidase-like 1 isoform X1 [Henckelia pumila]|uniref:serine carboxypeptidase-like 1 isoform X1 n=1 Tax=Henckelia pumila TaxID=405737 RepID=UPI003C6DCBA5